MAKAVAADVSTLTRGSTRIRIYRPRIAPLTERPVILLNGWPVGEASTYGPFGDGSLGFAMLRRGWTIYEPFTGANWGAQTATFPVTDGNGLQGITDAVDQAAADGYNASSVRIFGESMGGQNALVYAMLNPTKVYKAFIGVPVVSLESFVVSSPTAGLSVVGTYGGAGTWVANSVTRDPYRNNGLVDAVASKFAARIQSDDDAINYANQSAWLQARNIKTSVGTGGHSLWRLNASWSDDEAAQWLV